MPAVMALFISGLLLLTPFTLLVQCSHLKVTHLVDGRLSTYLEPVKFEGVTYDKRYRNASVSTELQFEMKSDVDLSSDLSLTWLLNDEPLEVARLDFTSSVDSPDIFSTEQYYELQTTAVVTLHLRDEGVVPGNYTLIATQDSVTAFASGPVLSAPILPYFHKPKRVLEGDIFHIICTPEGYPKSKSVAWLFAKIPIGQMDDDGVLATAIQNLQPLEFNTTRFSQEITPGGSIYDMLVFSELLIMDNGLYACNASNSEGSDISLILINVKDRWAALWPFVGIVVEVAVLVTAILLYERHQMRSKPTSATAAEVPGANQQTTTGKSAGVDNVGEYLPPQLATGNKLVTVVQPPNADTVDNAGVDAVNGRSYDDQKQDEVRIRGGTTKC